jgi:hypothetical protein
VTAEIGNGGLVARHHINEATSHHHDKEKKKMMMVELQRSEGRKREREDLM